MANYKTLGSVYAMSADYPFKRLAIGDVEGKIQLLDIRETAAGLELINPRVIDEGNRARISGFGFSPTSDALYALSGDGRLDRMGREIRREAAWLEDWIEMGQGA